MTFGIDIATSQAGIDLGRAKAEGVEFVIVKMGGLNVTPQYVAPHYKAQVDRAIAAGLPKGHYYLIGAGQSPEQQADFFVDNLHRFDPARDVLALDNELLNSNGTFWEQAEAARFVRRVLERLQGFPASRIWHYAGAADYRSLGPWTELAKTGCRFWWAAYGGFPTGRTPDHEPSLQGSIPRWDVHQFTSRSRVAGFDVDGNYSRHAVGVLFGTQASAPAPAPAPFPSDGGDTVTLHDKARAFARRYPKPKNHPSGPNVESWDQMCGNLVYRFGAYTNPNWNPRITGPNAWNVGLDSGTKGRDPKNAPVGAIHWWRNRNTNGMPGHVGVDLSGGGRDVFMATWSVRDSWGSAVGLQSVAGYTDAKPFMEYMGWTKNYAGAVFPVSARVASSPVTPVVIPAAVVVVPEEDDMAVKFGHRSTGGDEWMIVHPSFRGETEGEIGFLTTTEPARAVAWSRLYKNGWASLSATGAAARYDFDVPRDEYIEIQKAARAAFEARVRGEA